MSMKFILAIDVIFFFSSARFMSYTAPRDVGLRSIEQWNRQSTMCLSVVLPSLASPPWSIPRNVARLEPHPDRVDGGPVPIRVNPVAYSKSMRSKRVRLCTPKVQRWLSTWRTVQFHRFPPTRSISVSRSCPRGTDPNLRAFSQIPWYVAGQVYCGTNNLPNAASQPVSQVPQARDFASKFNSGITGSRGRCSDPLPFLSL